LIVQAKRANIGSEISIASNANPSRKQKSGIAPPIRVRR